jgi:uncharacterized protein (TIRG00374 family)
VVVLVAIGAYSRRHDLAGAFRLIGRLNWAWLGVAIGFETASFIAFARLQRWLLRAGGVQIGLLSMVEIVLAGNALAMSLPGGAAWAAAWAFGQLRRRGADRLLAGWVVLVAGALASFVLFLLLVAGSLMAGSKGPVASARWALVGLACIPALVVLGVVAARRSIWVRNGLTATWRRLARFELLARVERVIQGVLERARMVQPTPWQWVEASGLAALNWLETCACLIACIYAVHGSVPWRGILVAYTLAQVLASIPITPGGIGVVEGGLTALLVAYGLHTNVALAAVLLFRVVSFWGLVPVGWFFWVVLQIAGRPPRRRGLPHPWAVHRHRGPESVALPPRVVPDRLAPPTPCDGCDDRGRGDQPRREDAKAS